MLDRPRIVKEGNEAGDEDEDEEDEEDEDEELPSYLREQSSDDEYAALYSKNKLNANGKLPNSPLHTSCSFVSQTSSLFFCGSYYFISFLSRILYRLLPAPPWSRILTFLFLLNLFTSINSNQRQESSRQEK